MSDTSLLQDVQSDLLSETVWSVLIWDDPVNTMEYVSKVLQKHFSLPGEKAEELMLKAHNEGKAAVWSGEKRKAEAHCVALHGWGIQSSITN